VLMILGRDRPGRRDQCPKDGEASHCR
jgi:hypothetical protein